MTFWNKWYRTKGLAVQNLQQDVQCIYVQSICIRDCQHRMEVCDSYWWQKSLPLVFDKLCKSNRIFKDEETILSVLFRSLWRGCRDM